MSDQNSDNQTIQWPTRPAMASDAYEQTGQQNGGTLTADAILERGRELAECRTSAALVKLHELIRHQPEGDTKLRLAEMAADWIPEGETLGIVLGALQSEPDQGVLRSVKAMLRERVTRESLEAMVSLHEQSENPDVKERIESIIRGMTIRDAYDSLTELVLDRRFPLTDPLTAAAIEGLSHLDTPAAVNRLLQRLNDAAPEENVEPLLLVLAVVNQPQARRSLELAAQGMKEVENPTARAAATYALRNYLDETTLSLWQNLAAEQNGIVRSAAQQCLAWANSQTLLDSGALPDGR